MDGAEQKQTEIYPPPPPWFRLYRPDAAGTAERPLPPEPPVPPTGDFQIFGRMESAEAGVPPLNVKQLFNVNADGSVAFKQELKALNRELLLQYVDLIDVLISQPSSYARGVEAISTVLRNMHFLLNTLRIHQSRASLQYSLEEETKDRKQAIEDLRGMRADVAKLFEETSAKLKPLVFTHLDEPD